MSAVTGGSDGATAGSWTFTVEATDDRSLSAVALYVREPGAGGYTLAESQPASGTTASLSFTYTPVQEGTYEFYSVATDSSSNVEAAPPAPDRTSLRDTVAATITSADGAPPHGGSGKGSPVTITVHYSERVRCAGTAAACAAQFTYYPSGVGGPSLTGSDVAVQPDGLSAIVTFPVLQDNVSSSQDRIVYTPAATVADRFTDLVGNEVLGATVAPSNP